MEGSSLCWMLSIRPAAVGASELSKGGPFLRGSCLSSGYKRPLSVRSTHPRRLAGGQPKGHLMTKGSTIQVCRHLAGLSGQLGLAPTGWTSVPILTLSPQAQLRAGQGHLTPQRGPRP